MKILTEAVRRKISKEDVYDLIRDYHAIRAGHWPWMEFEQPPRGWRRMSSDKRTKIIAPVTDAVLKEIGWKIASKTYWLEMELQHIERNNIS